MMKCTDIVEYATDGQECGTCENCQNLSSGVIVHCDDDREDKTGVNSGATEERHRPHVDLACARFIYHPDTQGEPAQGRRQTEGDEKGDDESNPNGRHEQTPIASEL